MTNINNMITKIAHETAKEIIYNLIDELEINIHNILSNKIIDLMTTILNNLKNELHND